MMPGEPAPFTYARTTPTDDYPEQAGGRSPLGHPPPSAHRERAASGRGPAGEGSRSGDLPAGEPLLRLRPHLAAERERGRGAGPAGLREGEDRLQRDARLSRPGLSRSAEGADRTGAGGA